MPVTPSFGLTQTDEFVFVKIKIPYVKISSTELHCEGQDFTFYCRPYLLKLSLPFCVVDDERCRAVIDLEDENGAVTVHLPKEDHGKFFTDLDLSTKLLSLRTISDNVWSKNLKEKSACLTSNIEVLNSTELNNFHCDGTDRKSTSPCIRADLNLYDVSTASIITTNSSQRYGFNNMYCKVFSTLRELFCSLLEVEDPESTPPTIRRQQRITGEELLFCPERYIADYLEAEQDYIYVEAMKFVPHWDIQWFRWTHHNTADSVFDELGGFNEMERNVMQNKLPRRGYVIGKNSKEEKSVILGLVDILYAYCYDHRMNIGEENVESALNISRLSARLSWLESYEHDGDNIVLVMQYAIRRSLIYPYFRNWKFSKKILEDCAKIVLLGKKCILKSLLQVRKIFEISDTHYIFNKIFIDDYCAYIQIIDANVFLSLGNEMNSSVRLITKEKVGLSILAIEDFLQFESEDESDCECNSCKDELSNAHFSEGEEYKDYINIIDVQKKNSHRRQRGVKDMSKHLIQDMSKIAINKFDESIEALD